MTMQVLWYGTQQESYDLINAIDRNCSCAYSTSTRVTCSPHRMLIEDQRALNGLLFTRRNLLQLEHEERMDDTWKENRERLGLPIDGPFSSR